MSDRQDGSTTASQTEYRVLFLSSDGRIEATETVRASSDGRALILARAKTARQAVEVWDGLHFVDHGDARK